MAFKYFALFAFVATVAAVELQHAYNHQPALLVKHEVEDKYAPAEYTFEYSVHDDHTGDIKSQKETRNGDKVEGFYTLVDADGYKRVVHYTSDKHTGFNAVVEREQIGGHYQAPKQVKYVAPVVHQQAPVAHYQSPVVHKSAPVVHYQAPVVHKVVAHAPAHHSTEAHSTVSVQSHGVNYHY